MNTRPYATEAWRVLADLTKQAGAGPNLHPLLTNRPVKSIDLIVITSDRGLCGAFNYNVIRLALEFIKKQSVPVNVISVGRKGRVIGRARRSSRNLAACPRRPRCGRQPDRPYGRRRFSEQPRDASRSYPTS
jgi:ATP synthase F1 gamma subunit